MSAFAMTGNFTGFDSVHLGVIIHCRPRMPEMFGAVLLVARATLAVTVMFEENLGIIHMLSTNSLEWMIDVAFFFVKVAKIFDAFFKCQWSNDLQRLFHILTMRGIIFKNMIPYVVWQRHKEFRKWHLFIPLKNVCFVLNYQILNELSVDILHFLSCSGQLFGFDQKSINKVKMKVITMTEYNPGHILSSSSCRNTSLNSISSLDTSRNSSMNSSTMNFVNGVSGVNNVNCAYSTERTGGFDVSRRNSFETIAMSTCNSCGTPSPRVFHCDMCHKTVLCSLCFIQKTKAFGMGKCGSCEFEDMVSSKWFSRFLQKTLQKWKTSFEITNTHKTFTRFLRGFYKVFTRFLRVFKI